MRWLPWSFTKKEKEELLERMGSKCHQCERYKKQLDNYYPVFFEKIGSAYELRVGWMIALFIIGTIFVVGSVGFVVNHSQNSDAIKNRRECRQTCALIGGNLSSYMNDICYCRTPHIPPGFMQIGTKSDDD